MPRQWYIKSTHGFKGPFRSKVLRRLAREGKLTPDTGVSLDTRRWTKAKRIAGLTFHSHSSADQTEKKSHWFIRTTHHVVGPVSINRLNRMAADGRIQPNVAVSLDKVRWIKAKHVDGVRFPDPIRQGDGESSAADIVAGNAADEPAEVEHANLAGCDDEVQVVVDQYDADRSLYRRSAMVKHLGELFQMPLVDNATPAGVDVCIHPGNQSRPFTTLITNGISDIAMEVPEGGWSRRVEMVMYVRQPNLAYARLLQSLGTVARAGLRGFWYGATMSNGNPPKPIFSDSTLDSFVFMIPAVAADFSFAGHVQIDEEPLQLLWVLPITTAERNLITASGMQSFCDLLQRNHHDPLIDPNRACYIHSSRTDENQNGLSSRQQVG